VKIILILLFTISMAEGGYLEEFISRKNPTLSSKTVREVASGLKKYPKAITRIAEKESTFNPKASNDSCIGLMGICLPIWFSSNPDYNLIKLGILKTKKEVYSIKGNLKAGHYIWLRYKKDYRKYRGLK
jgi:hypothetical protein